MVSLNKVLMIGNLTRDPELRYTPQGTAVATVRIAVNTQFKDKTGETKKDTCFINVIVWGQLAEVCNQYLEKGRSVLVEGRLVSRSWQDSEGKSKSVIEIRAMRVQFMSGPKKEEAKGVDLGEEPEEIVKPDNEELGEAG
ncbi:MAG: single-stranded DNA-binding protein [Candidatus Omnitrophota bacterium]